VRLGEREREREEAGEYYFVDNESTNSLYTLIYPIVF